jgi:hypothetical protein
MSRSRLQVGIDISQQRLDVCALRADGKMLLGDRCFANSKQGYEALKATLLNTLESGNYSGVDIGGESTGYYWLPLALQLKADDSWQAYDPQFYLLNSRQVYWFKKGFAPDDKTDARDSYYIAEKLRSQRETAYPYSVDLSWLRLRFYSRLRFHLGQALTREKNYYWSHMFLLCSAYRRHMPFSDGFAATGRRLLQEYPDWQSLRHVPIEVLARQFEVWSHNRLSDPPQNVRRLHQAIEASYVLPGELQGALRDLLRTTLDHIALIEKQASQVERWLQREVNQHHPEVNHLVNIKGLGIVLAAGIAAEIGNLQRFFRGQKWNKRKQRFQQKNLRDVVDAVAKYAGLWWPRHDSGNFQGQERRMSKKGNRFLRYYLVEAADKLRQYQPQYQAYYLRKRKETKKHQHKRALALTARKSVGLFVGLLHRNEPYRPQEAS